jgi:hypothetical protein
MQEPNAEITSNTRTQDQNRISEDIATGTTSYSSLYEANSRI